MTNQPKDKSKPVSASDQKSDTVQLTAEDLRKISGGAATGKAPVQPQTADKVIPIKH